MTYGPTCCHEGQTKFVADLEAYFVDIVQLHLRGFRQDEVLGNKLMAYVGYLVRSC